MRIPTPDIDSNLLATLVGGQWRRTFASRKQGGECVFVFNRQEDENDILVLRNDTVCPAAIDLRVPGFGLMSCHSFVNDPALAGLQGVLEDFQDYRVLRYRPGKRISLAATHREHGPVIIKTVVRGSAEIFNRLRTVWGARNHLDFSVSEPVACFPEANTFVQRCLTGVPIDFKHQEFDQALIGRMARAVSSLHACGALFPYQFDVAAQRTRSVRYAHIIKSSIPESGNVVDRVFIELGLLENRIRKLPLDLKPIHGSLHSHQWLRDGDKLALVDFDRASMGHAELDIATFLAELDYESSACGSAINGHFLNGCSGWDPTVLTYYRVHKHFAKAYKASKSPDPEIALGKTLRNLGQTLNLLTPGGR